MYEHTVELALMSGGKIGHIARNCPMNTEGGGNFGGGGFGSQNYDNSGKTCYACGGFGTCATKNASNNRTYGERLQSRAEVL
jgi:cellular nucleic acid-binding protein